MTTHAGDRLSDTELRDLIRLLARYVEHDLDQFEHWQLATTHGPAHVAIQRALSPGWPAEAFTPVWPLPSGSTDPDDAHP